MSDAASVGGLATTLRGTGPTLVFLHGIGSSRRGFDGQIEHFESGYRCVAPDAPGYGDSPDPAPITDMDGWAEAIEDLLDDLGGGPAAVVGVSFGGVIATRLALRAVAPISALVLADTSRGSGVSAAGAAAMRERPRILTESGAARFAAERAPRLLAPGAPQGLIDSVARTMLEAVRLPGYAYAAEAMAVTDHTSTLSRISVPTLVVVGARDEICPPAESRAIAASIPDADYVEIAEVGHLANQEDHAAFNAAVESFLAVHHPPRTHETEIDDVQHRS